MKRTFWQFVATVVIVAVLWHFVWLVVAFALVLGLVVAGARAADQLYAAHQARGAARQALVARADQQHAWVLAGDERGVYGQYPASL